MSGPRDRAYLCQLRGWTINDVYVEDTGEIALLLDRSGEVAAAFVWSDPEANGPGWLEFLPDNAGERGRTRT